MNSVIGLLSILLFLYTLCVHFQRLESFFARENFDVRYIDGYGSYGAGQRNVFFPKCEGEYTHEKRVSVDANGNVSYNHTDNPEYIIHGHDRVAVQLRPSDYAHNDMNVAGHGEKCWIDKKELKRKDDAESWESDNVNNDHAWCDEDKDLGKWEETESCENISNNDNNKCNYSYVREKSNQNHLQNGDIEGTYKDEIKSSKHRCFWNGDKCVKSPLPCFNQTSYFAGQESIDDAPVNDTPICEVNTGPIDWLQRLSVEHL